MPEQTKFCIMKKIIISLAASVLFTASAFAQTERTNRTNTKKHDRSEVLKDSGSTYQKDSSKIDKVNHELDMDRNNKNKNNGNNTPGFTPGLAK